MFKPQTQLTLVTPGKMVKNRFGDLKPAGEVETVIPVVQWYVSASEESQGDSLQRIIDLLTVYVPVGVDVDPAGVFVLPDGSRWAIQGHGRDYNHGFHGWAPGVLVYEAKKVEG
ncbi:hypothetical protein G7Y31_06670 [Corynebacterium lizhenjunii]|uniref:Head-to-tail stopper n=1 Tax=Corynebacterium lizhenjunii TaxID=2709394 RepID=A0A7T0P902_9CORY|nr:hypothetical protein [Corynebacterium lizhenjunii]QPK78268.1 hypothetical protein G7Y31_06670 [Corynebacterium lizhenjunii]